MSCRNRLRRALNSQALVQNGLFSVCCEEAGMGASEWMTRLRDASKMFIKECGPAKPEARREPI